MFTQEELKNILVLIGRATIKGDEAMPTAQLQLKIQGMMQPEQKIEEKKEEEKTEEK